MGILSYHNFSICSCIVSSDYIIVGIICTCIDLYVHIILICTVSNVAKYIVQIYSTCTILIIMAYSLKEISVDEHDCTVICVIPFWTSVGPCFGLYMWVGVSLVLNLASVLCT